MQKWEGLRNCAKDGHMIGLEIWNWQTKKGEERGKKAGIKEGQKKTQIEIAKKMLEMEKDMDEIILITNLSQEEIENLQKELWFLCKVWYNIYIQVMNFFGRRGGHVTWRKNW